MPGSPRRRSNTPANTLECTSQLVKAGFISQTILPLLLTDSESRNTRVRATNGVECGPLTRREQVCSAPEAVKLLEML